MKRIFLFLMAVSAVGFISGKAYALGEIVQSCVPGTTNDPSVEIGSGATQVFYLDAATLDAITVRVQTTDGGSSRVHMQVSDVTSPGRNRVIAQKTEDVSANASWVVFDLGDVELPNGFYAVKLISEVGHRSVWFLGPTNCYSGGFAIYGGEDHQDADFRFAVYIGGSDSSDGANPPPANNGSQPGSGLQNGTSDKIFSDASVSSGDYPAGVSSSNVRTIAKRNSVQTVDRPTVDEILAMVKQSNEEDKEWERAAFRSLLWWLVLIIGGGVLFILILTLVIWLVLRSRNKKTL